MQNWLTFYSQTKLMLRPVGFFYFCMIIFTTFPKLIAAQETSSQANVFTGGIFMPKGHWELKLYNNLYTQLEPQYPMGERRSSFNTSFMQLTVGSNKNINYGFDFLYKSNVINDFGNSSPFHVFNFMNSTIMNQDEVSAFDTHFAHGLSHLGPRIRTKPFRNKKFTLQQAVYLPTGFLEEGWIINTDLFYEEILYDRFMLFGNVGIWYPLHADPFPYARLFAGTLIARRLAPFAMINLPYEVGGGMKFFISPKIELEFMYTYWLPFEFIVQDRNPSTLNFGLRVTNFNNF